MVTLLKKLNKRLAERCTDMKRYEQEIPMNYLRLIIDHEKRATGYTY